MLSKTETPANDAGTSRYNLYTQPVSFHSKYITTFKSQKFRNKGKINILKTILCYDSSYLSAPIKANCKTDDEDFCIYLPHKGKQGDCIIRGKTDRLGCYCGSTTDKRQVDMVSETHNNGLLLANLPHIEEVDSIANINPNHHNCARPTLKQALLITKNIKSICRPQQPFMGRSNESSINTVLINSTDRLKSLTSKNEFESCNEQSYIRTQLQYIQTDLK